MSAYDEEPAAQTFIDDGSGRICSEDPLRDDPLRDDPLRDDRLAEDRLAEDLLAQELIAAGEPEAPQMHDGIPIRGYRGGEPIPDLGRLPQERWREVLAPLRHGTRQAAKCTVHTVADAQAAGILVGELLLQDGTAVARAEAAPPPRMPAGALPARGSSRQLNYRLSAHEHARLLEAARLFGMRPTTLARVLTVRGVDRALYEERRDR